jgi:outer membrane protein
VTRLAPARRHGRQRTPYVACHDAQVDGSPVLAVAWQSLATLMGFAQLVLQKVRRSSQAGSGGVVPGAAASTSAGGGRVGATHAPRSTLWFVSAHVTWIPPTHSVSPHTSPRRSALIVTSHVQSALDLVHAIHDAKESAVKTSAREETGMGRPYVGVDSSLGRARTLVLGLVLAWPAAAAADGLSLEDAVHLALRNNERARKVPLRVEVAEGQLDRARDAFLPSLVASGGSTWRPDPGAKAPNWTTNGALVLSQPLLTPSAIPQYAQQRHSLESEKWGSVQDERQLAFDTAKAFVQALTAERVLASAQRKVDSAKLNVESSKARADAGLASTNDVTKAELQLATSMGQIANAQGNVTRTSVSLAFLVGTKIDAALVPPDTTTRAAQRYEQTQTNQVKVALDRRERALKAAQDRRADVRSLHERTEALRHSAREPLYRLLPSVSAQGQLRFVPDPLASEKAVDEQVSVNLSWQIFDGGFRYADRKQRLAQLQSSELDEQLLRRSVQNDVELALASLRAARANFAAAADAVAAAEKNMEETRILYSQGLAREIEVNDANDQQFQADVTRESAKLTMEQAYLDLRYALGFGPIDLDVTPAVSP